MFWRRRRRSSVALWCGITPGREEKLTPEPRAAPNRPKPILRLRKRQFVIGPRLAGSNILSWPGLTPDLIRRRPGTLRPWRSFVAPVSARPPGFAALSPGYAL